MFLDHRIGRSGIEAGGGADAGENDCVRAREVFRETSGGDEPQELFDLGDSCGSDVARHKDGYVGAAAEAAD